jgi:hypothetical protein
VSRGTDRSVRIHFGAVFILFACFFFKFYYHLCGSFPTSFRRAHLIQRIVSDESLLNAPSCYSRSKGPRFFIFPAKIQKKGKPSALIFWIVFRKPLCKEEEEEEG